MIHSVHICVTQDPDFFSLFVSCEIPDKPLSDPLFPLLIEHVYYPQGTDV